MAIFKNRQNINWTFLQIPKDYKIPTPTFEDSDFSETDLLDSSIPKWYKIETPKFDDTPIFDDNPSENHNKKDFKHCHNHNNCNHTFCEHKFFNILDEEEKIQPDDEKKKITKTKFQNYIITQLNKKTINNLHPKHPFKQINYINSYWKPFQLSCNSIEENITKQHLKRYYKLFHSFGYLNEEKKNKQKVITIFARKK